MGSLSAGLVKVHTAAGVIFLVCLGFCIFTVFFHCRVGAGNLGQFFYLAKNTVGFTQGFVQGFQVGCLLGLSSLPTEPGEMGTNEACRLNKHMLKRLCSNFQLQWAPTRHAIAKTYSWHDSASTCALCSFTYGPERLDAAETVKDSQKRDMYGKITFAIHSGKELCAAF